MKVVKIYFKKENASTLTSPSWYIRKVSDSYMVGLAICQTEEQYSYIKEHPKQAWDYSYTNKYKILQDYRDGKLTKLSMPTSVQDSEISFNKIANYIKKQDDSISNFMIEDVVRAYSRWNTNPVNIASYLDNEYLETYDDQATVFYSTNNENVWEGSTQLDADTILSLGYRNDASYCNDCELINIDEDTDFMRYVERADVTVCENCFDDMYSYCGGCDEAEHIDSMYFNDRADTYYCESCDSHHDDNGAIQSYDYSPPITFYDYKNGSLVKVDDHTKTNLPFYGAELEVESGEGSKYELAETISYYGGDSEKFCYCKNDGSLNDGFEVCFMPMTFYAIKNFNFHDAVLKYRGHGRILSYNTTTCGMHIHINREAFSDHHLFKFITFIHEFKSFIYLVSQRKKARELNSYARFNNGWKDRAKKHMVSSIKSKKVAIANNRNTMDKSKVDLHSTVHYGEKYVPINLQHSDTIEVRVFKGNLREVSFRKNFEFVDSLYYFTRDNPIYKLRLKEFVNHCTNEKKKYPNLNMFLADNSPKLKEILRFPLTVPEGLDY